MRAGSSAYRGARPRLRLLATRLTARRPPGAQFAIIATGCHAGGDMCVAAHAATGAVGGGSGERSACEEEPPGLQLMVMSRAPAEPRSSAARGAEPARVALRTRSPVRSLHLSAWRAGARSAPAAAATAVNNDDNSDGFAAGALVLAVTEDGNVHLCSVEAAAEGGAWLRGAPSVAALTLVAQRRARRRALSSERTQVRAHRCNPLLTASPVAPTVQTWIETTTACLPFTRWRAPVATWSSASSEPGPCGERRPRCAAERLCLTRPGQPLLSRPPPPRRHAERAAPGRWR